MARVVFLCDGFVAVTLEMDISESDESFSAGFLGFR